MPSRNILSTTMMATQMFRSQSSTPSTLTMVSKVCPWGPKQSPWWTGCKAASWPGGLNGPVTLPLWNTFLQKGGQRAVSYGSPRPPSTRTNSGPELLSRHPRLQTLTCPERRGTNLQGHLQSLQANSTLSSSEWGSDPHSVTIDGKTFLLPSIALGTPWGSSTSPLHHPPA